MSRWSNQALASLVAGGLLAMWPIIGSAQAPSVKVAFTDSARSGLDATRRVAISAVVLSFQASVSAKAGPSGMFRAFQSKDEVESVLALPEMDPALQQALAETAYRQLRADLAAAGYEVLPEEEVLAQPAYKELIAAVGITNPSKFANVMGDVMLAGPPTLKPYLAYAGETGPFTTALKRPLGWTTAFGGKSETPGGPSLIGIGDAWKLPGLEVKLAQSLNAHVVKAHYVIGIGKADAQRETSLAANAPVADMTALGGFRSDGYTRTTTGSGNAFAQVGLVADQTRVAFRAPNGNAKWQEVSRLSVVPAKDGDVVVRLAEPIEGGTGFFDVTGESSKKGGLADQIGGLFAKVVPAGHADINFRFTARIIDPAQYAREVAGMIANADRAMTDLVKR